MTAPETTTWPGARSSVAAAVRRPATRVTRVSRSSKPTVLFRSLYHGSASGGGFDDEYGLFLIRRSGLWAEHWRRMHRGHRPMPPPPPVDLVRETVIVLAVGTRPVLGFDVAIEDVTVREETLVVTATETRPVGDVTFDMSCSPVHVVAARVDPRSFDKMLLNLLIKPAEDE